MIRSERHIKKYESELKDKSPWFQDEMRYGTRSIIGRRWMSSGHRPKVEMKYGYSYHYLFQAVQPSTGKTFEMYLPNMSGICFKLFMSEFARKHPGKMMIMDNAGCHHVNWEDKEFSFPDVKIEYLSPYSPDFNPQERLFQEFKKVLKSKVYKDTQSIEKDLHQSLKFFWENPHNVTKLTNWEWI